MRVQKVLQRLLRDDAAIQGQIREFRARSGRKGFADGLGHYAYAVDVSQNDGVDVGEVGQDPLYVAVDRKVDKSVWSESFPDPLSTRDETSE